MSNLPITPEKKDNQRVFLWDNLKIILIMFVVVHHASAPYAVIEGQKWYQVLMMIIMPYTMPIFTIISGYWFKPRPLSVLTRKFLLPALLIIFLCHGLWYYSPVEYVRKSYPWTLDIMWYLWALFFYYLITPRILKFNLNVILISSVLFSLIAGVLPYIGLSFSLGRMIGFYPFFLLGIKLRSSARWQSISTSQKSVAVARIIFALTLILYFVLFLYDNSLSRYISFSLKYSGRWYTVLNQFFTLFFTYLICTVLSLSLIIAMPNKGYWFTKYGSRSLTPYILHPLLLYLFCWNLAIPIMDTWYGYLFYMLVIPALCMMTVHNRVDGFVKKLTS